MIADDEEVDGMPELYAIEGWSDIGVATVGAAAALTGLLFVAVSINLERILQFPQLPPRAASTLSMLVILLVVGIFLVTPNQPAMVLGIELGGSGLVLAAIAVITPLREARAAGTALTRYLSSSVLLMVPALCLVLTGALLVFALPGAQYWLAATFVTGFAASAVNAWVLLVEINR